MGLLLGAIVAGAILGVLVLILQGAIKLFIPQRLHPGFDRAVDAGFRWLARIVVLMILGLIGVVIWIINFG